MERWAEGGLLVPFGTRPPPGLPGWVSAEGIAHFSPRGVCDRLVKKQTAGAGASRQAGCGW